MSNLKYAKPPSKEDDQFDDFMYIFYEQMTSVQDPEDADGTLASVTTVVNNLLAYMREKGMIK
jgi:hypothetical protein